MPILETIAAANAAYSVIKTCLANGKETADLMSHVGKFLTAEEELKDAVNKKKKSTLTAITGGQEGDWEEFQQLEKIKEQRKELESYIRLYGSPGQWDRWISWQAEVRKQRMEARKAAEKRREKIIEYTIIGIASLAGIAALVFVFYVIGIKLGKW